MQADDCITIETKIDDLDSYPYLLLFCDEYNHIKRSLYRDLYILKQNLTELKKFYIKKYGITARHFNSIIYDLRSQVNSRNALLSSQIDLRKQKIKSIQKKTEKLTREIRDLNNDLRLIENYKKQIIRYKKKLRPKKPVLNKKLKNISVLSIKEDIAEKKYILHQKRRSYNNQRSQLVKEIVQQKMFPKICFGTKDHFKKQYHLEENNYSSHDDWKEDWDKKRNSSMFWVGSHDETCRNLNAQLDLSSRILKLKLPKHIKEDHLIIKNINFKYREEDLQEALTKEEDHYNIKKNVLEKKGRPVSYRILRRDESFYLQAIFKTQKTPVQTIKDCGAIGLDFNLDHIAVCELDRFGNPIWHTSHYFDSEKLDKNQWKALLSDYLSMIVKRARDHKKPIVIESLDFAHKKSETKENNSKRFSKKLTQFAYSEYQKLVRSKSGKEGVEVLSVNPRYTSLIGQIKFRGYKKLTQHELASLAIARRGLRLSERPKQKVTLKEPVRILDSEGITHFQNESKVRHVWSYWSRSSKTLRKQYNKLYTNSAKRSSTNPIFPMGKFCDSEAFLENSNKNFVNLQRRIQRGEWHLVRGKYCSFPAPTYIRFK